MATDSTAANDRRELETLAADIRMLLAARETDAAIARALGPLVTKARPQWTRYRAMPAAVPDVLWDLGETTIARGLLEQTATLRLRGTEFGIYFNTVAPPGERTFPARYMFRYAARTIAELRNQLLPAATASPGRRPLMRVPDALFRAVADFLPLTADLRDADFQRGIVAMAADAVDLAPFLPSGAVQARLAASEIHFGLNHSLAYLGRYEHHRDDHRFRTGLRAMIALEREFDAVPATWLTPPLNALQAAFFLTGHLTPLTTLRMAFAGLEPLPQFSFDTDHPVLRAAMRARVELRGPVRGFAQRLEHVLVTLDENEPIQYPI